MFWNHKKIMNEEEIKAIIEDLKKRLLELELEQARMKSHQISLRGLVNKKLGGVEKEELGEKKEISETENNIKPSIFLSPNGTPL